MITLEAGAGKSIAVYDSPREMAVNTAKDFVDFGIECVESKGSFFAAFSGGKTPEGFLQALTADNSGLDFDKTFLFLVDERMVPPDHPDSNQGMIRQRFIEPAGFPEDHFYPCPVNEPGAEKCATVYDSALKKACKSFSRAKSCLDLIVLGIGTDGHTASLFPDVVEKSGQFQWVHAARSEHHAHERVTLSEAFILSAGKLVFMAQGSGKADIVRDILKNNQPRLPASRIWEKAACAVMALDQAAARAYL